MTVGLVSRWGRYLTSVVAQCELISMSERLSIQRCSPSSFSLSYKTYIQNSDIKTRMDIPEHNAQILDGRVIGAQWQDDMKQQVQRIIEYGGRPPGLGVILVGDRLDSHVYVLRKQEACEKAGIFSLVKHLPKNVSQVGIRQAVKTMCADGRIDGILVQLPLPKHIDEEDVIEHFDPGKDVDGFHPLNVGRTLMRGRTARFVPCTALGCIELLRRSHISLQNKSVAIVGDSNIVGMPLAMLFRDQGASSVTVIHRSSYSDLFRRNRTHATYSGSLGKQGTPRPSSRICNTIVAQDTNPDLDEVDPPHPYQVTYASCREGEASSNTFPSVDEQEIEDMARVTRTADVVVIAVGYPELVTSSWIKEGAIVLDVGINVMNWGEENPDARGYNTTADARQICRDGMDTMGDDGDINPFHVVGDVHFASVSKKASAISPVPGGIGPMTIAALLQNTIRSAAWRLGVDNYVDVEP